MSILPTAWYQYFIAVSMSALWPAGFQMVGVRPHIPVVRQCFHSNLWGGRLVSSACMVMVMNIVRLLEGLLLFAHSVDSCICARLCFLILLYIL